MVRARAGKGTLGCLFSIVLVMALGYFAVSVGRPYLNHYKFQDRMKQEARFASKRSDLTIQRRLRLYADSLGLPESAQQIRIRRRAGAIEIWVDYYEVIEFPGVVREIYFSPSAVGTF
jgi:hypothetical protein